MNSPTSSPDPVGIGIIVPFDFALDREYWGYVPDHVTLHVTRTEYVYGDMGVDLAAAVAEEDGLARATVSLLAAGPAVVTYACTSGSFVGGTDGEERIRSTLRRAGAKDAQTTSGALIAALSALGCRHVAVATPYTPDVGERLLAYLGEHDIDTVSHVSMGLTGGIAHVPEQEILDIARSAMRPEADALFISCTNLATIDVIAPLERELGIAVLAANQVTMWQALGAVDSAPASHVIGHRLFRDAPTGRPV